MTILINLFGQPSAGKSTTMADLFATMKYSGYDVEICPEWVKKWCYQGKKISKYDQFYITGKEIKQQSDLFNNVEYAISDSPVFLGAFYNYLNSGDDFMYKVVDNFYKLAKKDGVKIINIFLKRNKEYNPNGRYQTEEESDIIGKRLEQWLLKHRVDYFFLECQDNERVGKILEILRKNV